MKVFHCACGTDITAADDDEIVRKVEAHVASDHPEMVGRYSRDQIQQMVHEH